MKRTKLLISTCLFLMLQSAFAQEADNLEEKVENLETQNQTISEKLNELKPGTNQFRVTGFSNITYHQSLEDFKESRFDHAGFSPIFIWRPSNKLFFESELHVELEGGVHGGETGDGHGHPSAGAAPSHEGSTIMDLGFANVGYFLSDNLTIVAGKFLSPFGTFNERYHPSWINLLPTNPLGFGHGGPSPTSELGAQIRGGINLGKSKANYSLYLSNGPVLQDGAEESDKAGSLIFSNFRDNNANKAVGGRFSILPFSNSALELGVSGQWADKVGDEGGIYEDVSVSMYAVDLAYTKVLSSLKGYVRLIGQYTAINVEDAYYVADSLDIEMGEDSVYTFDNSSSFYYGQFSFKPSISGNNFLRNLEFVVRYDSADIGSGSKWEFTDSRITYGLNYWLHARSVIKLAMHVGEFENSAFVQWAIGF